MNSKLCIFFQIIWLACLIVLLLLIGTMSFITYESMTYQILEYYHKLDKINVFRQNYLTPILYFYLKILLSVLFLIVLTLPLIIKQFFQRVSKRVIQLLSGLSQVFARQILPIQKISFTAKMTMFLSFSMLVSFHLYCVLNFTFLLDELFSYIYFVDKGWLVSATYYPGPNNHVFFSLNAVFLNSFLGDFFSEPVLILRLVSFFACWFSAIVIFFYLLKFHHWLIALLLSLIFVLFSPIFFYGFLGRGYVLQVFFVLLASISLLKIVKNAKQKISENQIVYHFIFCTSCVLGFYTIPTFLYPFVSFYVCLLVEGQWKKSYFWYNGFLITIITTFTYLPLFLMNGIQQMVNNDWVKSESTKLNFSQYKAYFWELADFYFPKSNILYFGLLVLILYNLCLRWRILTIRFTFWMFFVPFLMVFVQNKLPFVRVWTYFSIFFIIHIAFGLREYLKKNWLRYAVLFLLSGWLVWNNTREYVLGDSKSRYQHIAEAAYKNQIRHIFANEDAYLVFLRYEYLKNHQNLQIESQNFDKNFSYELIIFDLKQKLPTFNSQKYKKIFQNQEVVIFLLIGIKKNEPL